MSKRRVFHLIKGLGRGGAEGLLPQQVSRRGGCYDYAVGYFLPHKAELAPDLVAAGAEVTCFGARGAAGMLARTGAVARWLREGGADVCHAHLPLAGVVGRLAARRAGVPLVYTEHNLLERYRPPTRWADLATWRWQRLVVAVSADVAASIRRHAGERVPVEVVLNGIDVERYAAPPGAGEALRRAYGIAAGAPLVGTVAVMRRQKRLDRWLEAAAGIAAAQPGARFLVVGDGPLRGETEAHAGRLGLAGRVVFAGLRADVARHLAAMDVVLVSSDYEGLPLAVLEAMAAGRPVVAPAVGGLPEVLDEGCGRLVPPADAAALADAVLDLVADPALAARLGEAAQRRAGERFGIERMTRDLEAIYDRVLAGAGASR
ncbi:MAG TPA: glycosyltransferase [Thermoanaerobaculia bacterium]